MILKASPPCFTRLNDHELSGTASLSYSYASDCNINQKAAYNNIPVFIQGEHGTGKELIAKLIHHLGDWKDYRFYKIDCRILTEETFTAQLSRLFKESHDGTSPGTLYLREIGYLGQENQLRLVELIEEGFFQNGSEKKCFQKS